MSSPELMQKLYSRGSKSAHHISSPSPRLTTDFICMAYTAAKSLQSCPTLCDPIDGSPPGSPVPGILQARILEWVAISFSNAWKWKVKGKSLSRVWLLATPWTAAYQAPQSMGFSRQKYWSGVPSPSPWPTLTYPQSMLLGEYGCQEQTASSLRRRTFSWNLLEGEHIALVQTQLAWT